MNLMGRLAEAGSVALAPALVATVVAAPSPAPRGAWSVQPGAAMSAPRAAHQATLIDAHRVLLSGGCSGPGCSPIERSAELLDTRTRQTVPTGAMGVPRVSHSAASLGNGRVLVAGGWTGAASTASAEVFDTRTGRFTATAGEMGTPRLDATAAALDSGQVLVAGGAVAANRPLASTELFDPAANRFAPGPAMSEPRAHHAAVRLADGRVLIVGGQLARGLATRSAEIFDPASQSFTPAGPMWHPRCKLAAVLLHDGRVLVIAGSTDCNERRRLAETEIFDPATGRFTEGPRLANPRYKIVSAAAVMPQGEVVVAGDATDVEVWVPGAPSFVAAVGAIGQPLAFSTATPLPGGALWVVGGYDNDIRATARTWIVSRLYPGQPTPPGR
jgi:hypothetical protein